jgi:small subunit ribosomal protein S16
MTKIRLARVGSTHNPHYRIVVADSRNARDGRFIELLGSYNPQTNPSTIQINAARAQYWISVGAQVSNTVISILTRAGVEHSFKVRRKPFKKPEAEVTAATDAQPAVEDAPVTEEAAA